ncbi:hypothetical protein [Streptomyces sp. N35]|uniref:hypothetical protein n=1 Tax=Streptomyces sp. N35 TaxID=2795730 RepID=UPI0018F51207|nr:hypothetical protein [Streptomyces sp. N35]
MPDPTPRIVSVAYFIEYRPAPGQPWQKTPKAAACEVKADALRLLAYRREHQANWEHRLMQRVTTVTEQPAEETP